MMRVKDILIVGLFLGSIVEPLVMMPRVPAQVTILPLEVSPTNSEQLAIIWLYNKVTENNIKVLSEFQTVQNSTSPVVVAGMFSRARCFVILWTVAHQVPLSMGFSRQEYWNWLLFPSPGDLPNPGTEPRSFFFFVQRNYFIYFSFIDNS